MLRSCATKAKPEVATVTYVSADRLMDQGGGGLPPQAFYTAHIDVPVKELAKRRKAWKQPKPRYTRGLLAKYARVVSTASKGAVTDEV